MTDDGQLLEQYARGRSEAAFGELVRRHIDLVYSAALRVAAGDRPLAEDVTQTVFIDLARKAWGLPSELVLAGWLHRHTCYVAAKAIRTERRRKAREQTAMEMRALDDNTEFPWERIAPHLDESLGQLSAADRDAIVLRFLQRQDLRAVGAAFGISEDAAQKRVSRALERLRGVLSRRGVALTATALVSVLAAEAVTAAPAGLAAGVTAASLGAGAGTGAVLPLWNFMAATKLKVGIVSAIVVLSVVAPLVIHHQAQAKLRSADEVFSAQADQLAKLTADNQRLATLLARAKSSPALPNDQLSQLARLRGEVGSLRSRAQELTKTLAYREAEALLPRDQVWPARLKRLREWLEEHPEEKTPELRYLDDPTWLFSIYARAHETDDECRRSMSVVRANARGRVANAFTEALRRYAKDNRGEFPTQLGQLKFYFDSPLEEEILERWAIVSASSLVPELRPGGDWAITEKAPVNEALDSRIALGLSDIKWVGNDVTNRWALLR